MRLWISASTRDVVAGGIVGGGDVGGGLVDGGMVGGGGKLGKGGDVGGGIVGGGGMVGTLKGGMVGGGGMEGKGGMVGSVGKGGNTGEAESSGCVTPGLGSVAGTPGEVCARAPDVISPALPAVTARTAARRRFQTCMAHLPFRSGKSW
jgi:hypothetical protein